MSIALVIVQGSTTVVVDATLSINLRQDYSAIEAATLHRLADGTALKQARWSKLATSVSGDDVLPPGFAELDFGEPMDIWCVQPSRLSSAVPVIALPVARRVDVDPYAFAVLSSGRLVPVTVDVAGDVATIQAVPGAARYALYYYPILTVYATPPSEAGDIRRATYGWTLDAEEV